MSDDHPNVSADIKLYVERLMGKTQKELADQITKGFKDLKEPIDAQTEELAVINTNVDTQATEVTLLREEHKQIRDRVTTLEAQRTGPSSLSSQDLPIVSNTTPPLSEPTPAKDKESVEVAKYWIDAKKAIILALVAILNMIAMAFVAWLFQPPEPPPLPKMPVIGAPGQPAPTLPPLPINPEESP